MSNYPIGPDDHSNEKRLDILLKNMPIKEAILEMSPSELVNFFRSLDKSSLTDFFAIAVNDPELLALLSYWQKWLHRDQRELVDRLTKSRNLDSHDSESLPLNLEKKYTPDELSIIFSNTAVIQLTFGCSYGCAFCGFDAIKGVREHIPYSQLSNMFKCFGKELNVGEPFLYWASDPSDYASKDGLEDRTYQDVHQLAVRFAKYNPGVTSINTRDKEWVEFMVDTNIVNGFRGSRRFSVQANSANRGEFYNEQIDPAKRNNVEILSGTPHEVGMGLSRIRKKNDIEYGPQASKGLGIACKDGVLLTPRGIYNMLVIKISDKYPQGTIVVPFKEIGEPSIQVGDSLDSILPYVVVRNFYSHDKDREKGYGSTVLHTRNKRIVIDFNAAGKIIRLFELPPIPKKSKFGDPALQTAEQIDQALDEIQRFFLEIEEDRKCCELDGLHRNNMSNIFKLNSDYILPVIQQRKTKTAIDFSNSLLCIVKQFTDEFLNYYTVMYSHKNKRHPNPAELLTNIEEVLLYLHELYNIDSPTVQTVQQTTKHRNEVVLALTV